jgi:hypothetical protein
LNLKGVLTVTIKVIGVLTMIWVIPQFFQLVYSFFSMMNQPGMVPGDVVTGYRLSLLIQAVIPVLLFVIGLYLLRGGDSVIRFAYKGEKKSREIEEQVSYESLFLLFIKMVGLGMIVYALPMFFQLLSNILFIASVQSPVRLEEEITFVIQNAVSTLIYLIGGFYLLKSGDIFYNLAFPKKQEEM